MNHPILAAASDIRSLLKGVAGANPTFMSTSEKAAALRELVAAEAQVVELRLRVLAGAGDLADATGAKDSAGWLVHETRTRFADARADLALAGALDRERPVLAAGMRDGAVTLAQAHVIRRSLDALPAAVDMDTVTRAEAHLVACATEFGPKELGRVGRRVLDVVAPEVAEAAEAARLADLEAHAADKTRMTLRRQGDGTTRLSALVPDAVATRLATYLEAFANPRAQRGNDPASESDDAGVADDPFTRLPYPRRMGEAFARFLETADPTRLPVHGGDATTVIVTIPLDSLRAELATADLIGAGLVPGDDLTGDRTTASQARRLACTAKILPAVLGGTGLPVDLGSAKRLFTPAQRKALLIRDRTCRAEGCDVPGTWCDAHHLDPWRNNGPTDLDNGILLCSHHHHRVHDTGYRTDRLPSGDLRFHRRT
ncbi:HNH endonuclease signature motif containing protein [Nocardioides lacusdianchii]|uniref:HNH endonuclease signature motif containing protein n=1 Tax=Nocardioides lacusdianchii TaxID=2783664 RepID=UPI001CCD4425|nr:HNH endonuclease signature motif containing protein [Nocardioides lacusdianchii]